MKSKNNLNQKIDDIYKEVGEFGPYQLVLFCLIARKNKTWSFT